MTEKDKETLKRKRNKLTLFIGIIPIVELWISHSFNTNYVYLQYGKNVQKLAESSKIMIVMKLLTDIKNQAAQDILQDVSP